MQLHNVDIMKMDNLRLHDVVVAEMLMWPLGEAGVVAVVSGSQHQRVRFPEGLWNELERNNQKHLIDGNVSALQAVAVADQLASNSAAPRLEWEAVAVHQSWKMVV
jgi:hypothetical protein